LKAQAGKLLLEWLNGFRRGRSFIDSLFSMNYLYKNEESLIFKTI